MAGRLTGPPQIVVRLQPPQLENQISGEGEGGGKGEGGE